MAEEIFSPFTALAEANTVDQFVHQIVDTITGQPAKFVAQYAKTIPTERLENLVEATTAFVVKAAASAWPKDKIADQFEELTQQPKPVAKAVAEAIFARQGHLRAAALRRLATFNGKALADFDWKVAVAWSSSNIATLKTPMLQLDLILVNSLGKPENVPVEFTLPELKLFIGTLENINKTRLEIKV